MVSCAKIFLDHVSKKDKYKQWHVCTNWWDWWTISLTSWTCSLYTETGRELKVQMIVK